MLALVETGHVMPSAELVATQAGVGLRTVFRHFADMESLYAAMTATLAAHYDRWLAPFAATGWREQLFEAAERRLSTYERLLPFKRAADAHRHMSPAIQHEHERMLALMRARLMSIMPGTALADAALVETIDLLLSFEAWQRLRTEQHLGLETARSLVLAELGRLAQRIVDDRTAA